MISDELIAILQILQSMNKYASSLFIALTYRIRSEKQLAKSLRLIQVKKTIQTKNLDHMSL